MSVRTSMVLVLSLLVVVSSITYFFVSNMRSVVRASPGGNVTVFNDTAELWGDGDCGTGYPWDTCTCTADGDLAKKPYEHSGTYAIQADDFDTACRALDKIIDLSSYDKAYIDVWWCGYSLDTGEYARLEIYNGSWYTLLEINKTNDQGDTSPEPVDYSFSSIEITEYNLSAISNISWSFFMDGSLDLAWFDDLYVYGWSEEVTTTTTATTTTVPPPAVNCTFNTTHNTTWDCSYNCNVTGANTTKWFIIYGGPGKLTFEDHNLSCTGFKFNATNCFLNLTPSIFWNITP